MIPLSDQILKIRTPPLFSEQGLWHSIKLSDKVAIKFDKDPLAVEQNNFATKIVNAYTVYELDTSPNVTLKNYTLENCLSGATSIVKNRDKEQLVRQRQNFA